MFRYYAVHSGEKYRYDSLRPSLWLNYGTTACKWDQVIPFEKLWPEYKRIIKDNGAIVLFGSEPFSSVMRMSNLKMYKYDWIWEKSKASNFQHAKYQPLKAHETISVFSKKPAAQNSAKNNMKYYPNMTAGKEYKGFNNPIGLIGTMSKGNTTPSYSIKGKKRFPKSVQYFKTAECDGKFHITQKPTELLEYLIKTYTLEGDIVLDNTMGSCSAGVACLNTNRKFIGIEKDEKYFDVSTKRISDAQKIKFASL